MPNYPSISGGVETPTVTPTQIVNDIKIRKTGKVVNATISVKPTVVYFSIIALDFPKPAFEVRSLGINTGGAMINSWLYIDTTGCAHVYCGSGDTNTDLLFSITYITSD